jgi:dephospho-CoA kinase
VVKLRIGLTGGIGSGKSSVAAQLVQHGATLIDTDAIARRLTEAGGAAISAIVAAFGADFIDANGALARDRMREQIFADPSAKLRLESILHPLIGDEAARQANDASTPVLVFDVPLLAESAHWRGRVDRVLVVDCSEATQIDRVVRRSGLRPQAVQAIIEHQATRGQRRACADAVIWNDAMSLSELAREVHSLWHFWVAGRL